MSHDPTDLVIRILTAGPVFLFALVFHEYCHALVAARLGDRLAAWTGRLTLNPMVHLDPIGSVAMPMMGILVGWWYGGASFIFGWARPVPFNPRDLRNASRDTMLIAIAGPLANLVLLFAFGFLIRALHPPGQPPPDGVTGTLLQMAAYGVYINGLLAVFNMIPLPPLDGSKVVAWLLGPELGSRLLAINPMLSLIVLFVMVGRGLLSQPLAWAIQLGEWLAGVPLGPLLI